MEYLSASWNAWLPKLVDWVFISPCWLYLQCCYYCHILLKEQANERCERFYIRELPSSALRSFGFCRLFINALFLRFKIRRHARVNARYGFLSKKWFTPISALIYFTFLALHPCYLLYMGKPRFSKLSSLRC